MLRTKLMLSVSQTEQAMNEAGDKLDPNDKQEVQADLDALKATVAGNWRRSYRCSD